MKVGTPPCERMKPSARRSSSPVVTPGRTCSPISSSVRATITPADAIWSISRADLRTITSDDPRACAGGDLLDRLLHLGEHLADGAVGVHADDAPARAVAL